MFHLDSGKKQMAPLDNLVELPQHLRAIPRLTRPTKLAGIKPCGLCWSPSALAVLRGMKDVSSYHFKTLPQTHHNTVLLGSKLSIFFL